jgi:RimJ/RimL family protein N-acetyltransferase
MNMQLIRIGNDNKHLIQGFLNEAGDALTTFRYFNKRGLESLQNHLITLIITVDNTPCGYGHLDKEKDKVWLGIAVGAPYQGKGLGKIILKKLIEYAKEKQIPNVTLSVDKINSRAIQLYEDTGFVLAEIHESYFIYLLTLKDKQEV